MTAVAPPRASRVRYTDPRPADLIPDGDYRVRPGDILEVRITDLVGPGVETITFMRVKESGRIALPLLGDLRVAGLTEAEIDRLIYDEFRKSSL